MGSDLLGGLDSLSFGAPARPAPAAAGSVFGLSTLVPTQSTPTLSPMTSTLLPTPAAPVAAPVDLLGGLMGGPALTPMPAAAAAAGPIDGWQELPSLLASHAHSDFAADIAADATLRVNYRKVWKPEGLVVVLYLFNKTGRGVSGISTHLDIQGVRHISSIGFGDGSVSNTLNDNIAANGYARHILTLTTAQPAAGMTMRGQITYVDATPRNVYFSVPLVVSDFLRPRALTVPEFGANWEKLSAERKQRISPSSITSMESLQARVEKELNVKAIQVIGKELICGAQVLEDPSSLCLLHVVILTKGVEVTTRAGTAPVAEALMRQCAAAWKA